MGNKVMRTTLNAIILVAILAILTACEGGNEYDSMAPKAPADTTNNQGNTTTPQPTDNSEWSTVYGGDASMDNDGFVRRYLLIARKDTKTDSVVSNYQVLMNVPDTTRISYMGTELVNPINGIIPTQQSLYSTGSESYTEGQDHVWRASEHTAHEIYVGATMVNVTVERQLAKVIVKGKPYSFEFADYSFNATKESFRVVIDTIDKEVYRHDILDGKVHMKQGTGDFSKPFVVIMDRVIGEVETPDTPEEPKANPMPSCIVVDGKAVFYGTITPIVAAGKLSGFDNIIIAQTNDSLYAVHAASAKVVAKGSRAKYPRTKDQFGCYTAVKVNGVWKLAFVDYNHKADDNQKAYVYAWGTASTENISVPVAEYVTGGAKNLDEKGKSYQNPFLRVVVSDSKEYDNGFTYQVQAYNYTKMVANLLVGYFK